MRSATEWRWRMEPTKVSERDIETIERLSDAAIRAKETKTALQGYALALRLRSETGLHPQRRSTDA